MIGYVTDSREAVLPITVRGPSRLPRQIEAVIDTGFNGHLALPPESVAVLGLPFHSDSTATLADDTEVMLPLHTGQVEWDGTERRVFVLSAAGSPLLGMSLLYGSRLVVDVIEGGPVTITPIVENQGMP
jgi:clan AA aspartic protease